MPHILLRYGKCRQLVHSNTEINVAQRVSPFSNVSGMGQRRIQVPGLGSPHNTVHPEPHFSCDLFFPLKSVKVQEAKASTEDTWFTPQRSASFPHIYGTLRHPGKLFSYVCLRQIRTRKGGERQLRRMKPDTFNSLPFSLINCRATSFWNISKLSVSSFMWKRMRKGSPSSVSSYGNKFSVKISAAFQGEQVWTQFV